MPAPRSDRFTSAVLHPSFALTGVLHAIGGALLPSLASAFHLSDSKAGALFFSYYAGTSIGALFCVRGYVRLIVIGFTLVVPACVCIAANLPVILQPLFLALGIGVGLPMTAINMFAARKFAGRTAAPLTFLNFSWSVGALIAPLLAARILLAHTYRAAYLLLAIVSAIAALACAMFLREPPEPMAVSGNSARARKLLVIALFALLTFLEVGVENTVATWLATYTLRTSTVGAAIAAASTSFYWFGFLASRGIASLLLMHVDPSRMLRINLAGAVIASASLLGLSSVTAHNFAMFAMGAALAPVFPLLLSLMFARVQSTSDARWVMALCGFGGSVLPWLTGFISSQTHNLRLGLALVPAAILLMLLLAPALGTRPSAPPSALHRT